MQRGNISNASSFFTNGALVLPFTSIILLLMIQMLKMVSLLYILEGPKEQQKLKQWPFITDKIQKAQLYFSSQINLCRTVIGLLHFFFHLFVLSILLGALTFLQSGNMHLITQSNQSNNTICDTKISNCSIGTIAGFNRYEHNIGGGESN